MVLPRPRIDLSEEEQQHVKEYAERNGLRMPRAYGDLVRAGLDSESD